MMFVYVMCIGVATFAVLSLAADLVWYRWDEYNRNVEEMKEDKPVHSIFTVTPIKRVPDAKLVCVHCEDMFGTIQGCNATETVIIRDVCNSCKGEDTLTGLTVTGVLH
jgi:hypothetical protein